METINRINDMKNRKSKKQKRVSKDIQITIKRIENKDGEYVAYYRSEFLNATYLVYFRDNIFGSVALHEFSEMIKSKYNESNIDFVISNEKIQFKSKALLEAMRGSRI